MGVEGERFSFGVDIFGFKFWLFGVWFFIFLYLESGGIKVLLGCGVDYVK